MYIPRDLLVRDIICRNDFGDRVNCNSAWNRWVRWLVAGILLLIAAILVAFVIIRRNRLRRRMYGRSVGTPYVNQNPGGYGAQPYAPPPGPPPPQYAYPQENGIAQPPNTYQGNTGYK